ncbi:MAG TPA: polyprenyl synthetase family protein, partial [Bacteroidales bacterium]|nr:polyprenyl synthetase family protein [Bacteroidales bacterium]
QRRNHRTIQFCGADDAGARSLYDCGMNLGIAFQLQDDLLDVYSDEDIFGKKTGGDIVANKKTFPYLKALETASSSQHERLISLFQRQTDDDTAKVSEVKEIYSQLNIREHTRDAMNDYYARALQNLESVRVDDQRKGILVSLIHEMKDRTY